MIMSSEKQIFESYWKYCEREINFRRIRHSDFIPLLLKHKECSIYRMSEIGKSVEKREIYKVEAGKGNTKVFLWSQMHGNEPTATQAILDILHFLKADDEFNDFRNTILNNLTVWIVPLLNPDGAELFTRENSLFIDINRDALRLVSPEARILKSVCDEFRPEFGFNLHDQPPYYRAGTSPNPSTIAFLFLAFNFEKEVNQVREKAMKVIAGMSSLLKEWIPEGIAKYSDEFEPRAFGDNITKWGISTILIESGGYPEDPEKQFVRKLNFVAILSALHSIATKSYEDNKLTDYYAIPFNKKEHLFDLLVKNVWVEKLDSKYLVDIAINRLEKEIGNGNFSYESKIMDIGDLSVYNAYEVFDASGLVMVDDSKQLKLEGEANFILKDEQRLFKVINGVISKF